MKKDAFGHFKSLFGSCEVLFCTFAFEETPPVVSFLYKHCSEQEVISYDAVSDAHDLCGVHSMDGR